MGYIQQSYEPSHRTMAVSSFFLPMLLALVAWLPFREIYWCASFKTRVLLSTVQEILPQLVRAQELVFALELLSPCTKCTDCHADIETP